ncbi:heterokaryon incompatibility 6 OR allele [Fusarium coicis]|nr:heterokaryon incompatibility 6 OR allele [Fusarium coicis]
MPSEGRQHSQVFFSEDQFRTEMETRLSQPEFADGWIKFCDVLNSPWTHIKKKLKRAQATRGQIARSITKVLSILLAKKEWLQSFDLKRLLVYTQNSQSSDQRDRIYSMTGLAHPGYATTPDYPSRNKIENLLVETTKRIITFEDSLDVLSYLSRGDPSSSGSGELLPSWVVDWTKVQNTLEPMLYRTNMDWDGSKFVAHNIKPGYADALFVQVPHPVHPELSTTALQVWAVFLDTQCIIGRWKIFVVRPVRPPIWNVENLSKYTDESGDLDPSKMERKRITIV